MADRRWYLNPTLLYTLGRIAIFAVVAAVLYAFGFRSVILVVLALVLSMPLSYVLLRGVRLQMSAQIEEKLARRRAEKERLRSTLRGDDEAMNGEPKK